MKSITLTDIEATLVDVALRSYWGKCKRLMTDSVQGEEVELHETLLHCNTVRNKLSSYMRDGYYQVTNGNIEPLIFEDNKIINNIHYR
jgi:hypothetical protein